MIISQSCDIQRRDYVHVCPINSLEKWISDFKKAETDDDRINNAISDLKNNRLNYYFYLPSIEKDSLSFSESYVDLQVINSIPTSKLAQLERKISLSDKGRHKLAFKLNNFLGRPF